jgi:hypothetical protein
MGAICRPAALIAAHQTHPPDDARAIRFRAAVGKTCTTLLRMTGAARTSSHINATTALKNLVVIVLIALLLFLFYRRLRPYLRSGREFLRTIRHFQQAARGRVPELKSEKLIRCAQCETWIPAGRALRTNACSYCSRACLEAAAADKRRKTAS